MAFNKKCCRGPPGPTGPQGLQGDTVYLVNNKPSEIILLCDTNPPSIYETTINASNDIFLLDSYPYSNEDFLVKKSDILINKKPEFKLIKLHDSNDHINKYEKRELKNNNSKHSHK